MSDLSTNFKDDVLNTSVNKKRRYQMIYNSDGTVSFEDVTNYSQVGSDYGANEVNEERKAINGIQGQIDELNSNMFQYMGTSYIDIGDKNTQMETIYSYTNSSNKTQLVFFTCRLQAPSTGAARYDIYLIKNPGSKTYANMTFPCNQTYPCVSVSASFELEPNEYISCDFWASASLEFFGSVSYSVFQK